jgi:hypothetical protein
VAYNENPEVGNRTLWREIAMNQPKGVPLFTLLNNRLAKSVTLEDWDGEIKQFLGITHDMM